MMKKLLPLAGVIAVPVLLAVAGGALTSDDTPPNVSSEPAVTDRELPRAPIGDDGIDPSAERDADRRDGDDDAEGADGADDGAASGGAGAPTGSPGSGGRAPAPAPAPAPAQPAPNLNYQPAPNYGDDWDDDDWDDDYDDDWDDD